ncbi:HNH endonuclease [Streptomyces sp. NPDC052042]|uniref:HNH endonuclease n=1 Tax=Streptomyces sp. NPDC052042 TaxID=3365683 RepID=UPI0037D19AC2
MNDVLVLACLLIALSGSLLLLAGLARRRHRRDPQRLFTWQQKRALLARSGYRCEHKHPLWRRCRRTDGLEADHIVPWSRGGPTELWNGQVLCRRHNTRKSNRIPSALYRWRLARRRRRY